MEYTETRREGESMDDRQLKRKTICGVKKKEISQNECIFSKGLSCPWYNVCWGWR